jgi:hypothetical protein
MLFREYVQAELPDLTCTPHADLSSKPFYLKHHPYMKAGQSDRCEVVLYRASYENVPGGILSDKAGFGKTLTTLSFIAATKNRLAIVDSQTTDRGPLHFRPYTELLSSRNYVPSGQLTGVPFKPSRGVPSLFDLCTLAAKFKNVQLPSLQLPFSPSSDKPVLNEGLAVALSAMPVFYDRPSEADVIGPRKGTRGAIRRAGRTVGQELAELAGERVLISKTTLLIVPDNLIKHWTTELGKHIAGATETVLGESTVDPYVWEQQLRYRVSRSQRQALIHADAWTGIVRSTDDFPTDAEIAKNDILLAARSVMQRFATVGSDLDQLAHIHFARIVLDEGDWSSGESNLVQLVKGLRKHSIWLVTATPTTNLNSSHSEQVMCIEADLGEPINEDGPSSKLDELNKDLGKVAKLVAFLRMPRKSDPYARADHLPLA